MTAEGRATVAYTRLRLTVTSIHMIESKPGIEMLSLKMKMCGVKSEYGLF